MIILRWYGKCEKPEMWEMNEERGNKEEGRKEIKLTSEEMQKNEWRTKELNEEKNIWRK